MQCKHSTYQLANNLSVVISAKLKSAIMRFLEKIYERFCLYQKRLFSAITR